MFTSVVVCVVLVCVAYVSVVVCVSHLFWLCLLTFCSFSVFHHRHDDGFDTVDLVVKSNLSSNHTFYLMIYAIWLYECFHCRQFGVSVSCYSSA